MQSLGLQCSQKKMLVGRRHQLIGRWTAATVVLMMAVALTAVVGGAEAKTLGEHQQHHRVHHRRAAVEDISCDAVKTIFDQLNVTVATKGDATGKWELFV